MQASTAWVACCANAPESFRLKPQGQKTAPTGAALHAAYPRPPHAAATATAVCSFEATVAAPAVTLAPSPTATPSEAAAEPPHPTRTVQHTALHNC